MASDLHAQLLAATAPLVAGEQYSVARLNGPLAALRAVVELHAPINGVCGQHFDHRYGDVPYPCDEIKTIARELGVSDD